MTPKDVLAYTIKHLATLKQLNHKAAFVGLPKEAVGGEIYGGGRSIIANGATHEYGYGPIPQRSFLRVPFDIKRAEIATEMKAQFSAVVNGQISVDTALGRIGAAATNVSKGAFTSLGYDTWTPDTPETIRRKGRSQTLIDTGILRSSITWVIRDAST